MKIRLEGPPIEVDTALAVVRQSFQVLDKGKVYPNRGSSQLVRRYVSVNLKNTIPSTSSAGPSSTDAVLGGK